MSRSMRLFWGIEGLRKLMPRWQALLERVSGRSLYHHPEWYEAYVTGLEKRPDEVVFGGIEEDGELMCVWPLKISRRSVGGVGIRCLDLPARDHMHLGDIVMADQARSSLTGPVLLSLLRGCAGLHWDMACLRHIMEGSAAYTVFRASPADQMAARQKGACCMIELRPYEEMLAGLSKKFRSNLRNAHNRLAALGEVRYEAARGGEDLERAFVEFLELEASGWKGAAGSGTAIKLDPAVRAFYEALVKRFSSAGSCEVHVLRGGDASVAAAFTLVCDGVCYVLKVGYDPEYARVSPVHLLLGNIFSRHGAGSDVRRVNLISDAQWLDPWQPGRVGVFNVFLFNRTMRGMAAHVAARIRREKPPVVEARPARAMESEAA